MDEVKLLLEEARAIAELLTEAKDSRSFLGGKMIGRLVDCLEQLDGERGMQMPMIAASNVQPSLFDNLPQVVQLPKRTPEQEAEMLTKTLVSRWKEAYGLDNRVPTHLLLAGFAISQEEAQASSKARAKLRIAHLFAELVDPRMKDPAISSRLKGRLMEDGLDMINLRLNHYLFYSVHDNGRYFVLSSRRASEGIR